INRKAVVEQFIQTESTIELLDRINKARVPKTKVRQDRGGLGNGIFIGPRTWWSFATSERFGQGNTFLGVFSCALEVLIEVVSLTQMAEDVELVSWETRIGKVIATGRICLDCIGKPAHSSELTSKRVITGRHQPRVLQHLSHLKSYAVCLYRAVQVLI